MALVLALPIDRLPLLLEVPMRMRCRLDYHRGLSEYFTFRNGARRFSSCYHCRDEIVKLYGQRWRRIPKGYRVVWRTRVEMEAVRAAANNYS
jgi:hypothetical protein